VLVRRALGVIAAVTAVSSVAQAQPCTTAHRCRTVLASLGGHYTSFIGGAFVVDGNAVYVNTARGVERIPTNGSASTVLTPPAARAFTVDAGELFWSDASAINMTTIATGVTSRVVQLPQQSLISNLVVSHALLFWISDMRTIQCAPAGGGAITTLLRSPPTASASVVGPIQRLITDGTYLYYSSNGDLQRMQLAGGSVSALTKSMYVTGFNADAAHVYASTLGVGLVSITASNGALHTIALNTGLNRNLPLVAGVLYWLDDHGGIGSVSVSSPPVTVPIATGSDVPVALAADATNLYYVTQNGDLVKITPR
jgi:hypothetical protein